MLWGVTEVRGGAFYDDPNLLDAYLEHRHASVSSPNLVMEDPAFMAEVGDLAGQRVLDLGCGDGTFARQCVDAGARSFVGVDGSHRMIERANEAVGSERVRFLVADLEELERRRRVPLFLLISATAVER